MPLIGDPLAHAGLTVAATMTVEHIVLYAFKFSRTSKAWRIDYRLVILGALLPDLIDRPLALWILPEIVDSTRGFAHTLVFNAFLSMLTLSMMPFTKSPTLLAFSLASAGHLLIDRMWEVPETLYWPLLGTTFGRAESDLSPYWLQWIRTTGGQILIVGFGTLVLVFFATRLYRRRTLLKWLRTGVE